MHNFLKVFLLLFVISCGLFSNDFKDVHQISLKKDEQTKILVKYNAQERLLKFRWTLFNNGGLVIHRSYDRAISQNILYLNHKNQSFRVELKPRGADFYNVPYMLVKFKEFDYAKKEALLEIFLSDERNQLELKYLKNS